MNCLVQSQVDITELLCLWLATAGDKSRRKCEHSISPSGFTNPLSGHVLPTQRWSSLPHSTGTIPRAKRLEGKAKVSTATSLWIALCLYCQVPDWALLPALQPAERPVGWGQQAAERESDVPETASCCSPALVSGTGSSLGPAWCSPRGQHVETPVWLIWEKETISWAINSIIVDNIAYKCALFWLCRCSSWTQSMPEKLRAGQPGLAVSSQSVLQITYSLLCKLWVMSSCFVSFLGPNLNDWPQTGL